ncbi:hypothetical protein BLOT_014679 [Blomia tropicalis]|nr:hypothetical protein BLOT_014679 [Blomia tropicalis]
MKLSKFKRFMYYCSIKIINRFLAFTCDDQPPIYQATLFILAEGDGPVLLPTLILFVTTDVVSIWLLLNHHDGCYVKISLIPVNPGFLILMLIHVNGNPNHFEVLRYRSIIFPLLINHLLIWISLLLSWKKINFNFSGADHLLADLGFIKLSRGRSIIFFIGLDFIDANCRILSEEKHHLHYTPLKPFASNCFLNIQLSPSVTNCFLGFKLKPFPLPITVGLFSAIIRVSFIHSAIN